MPQATGVAAPKQRLSTPQTLHLMRLEVERALRHGYPISCMMLGLDGFVDLDHLFHRKKVMPLVFRELKTVTFERDVRGLGIWTEGFQLAVFPHVEPEALQELAEALRERASAVEYPELEGVEITVSIGISHNLHRDDVSFESLVTDAESGMGMAQGLGGDQVSAFRQVETEVDQLKGELEAQLQEIQAIQENVFAQSCEEEELWGRDSSRR